MEINFDSELSNIKSTEQSIKNMINVFKSSTSKKSPNQVKSELELSKKLDQLKLMVDKFSKEAFAYSSTKEDKAKVISQVQRGYEYLRNEYNFLIESKYKFTPTKKYDAEYEKYKEKTLSELKQMHQSRLDSNNDKIDIIIKEAQKGKKISQEIGNNLEKQNFLLEKLHKDCDDTEKQMIKTTGKINEFIQNSSFCKLYFILGIEFFLLFVVILCL